MQNLSGFTFGNIVKALFSLASPGVISLQIVLPEMLWGLKLSLCFSAFMLATQLNPLVEEERLSSNCICQINRFIVNTLKDGRYAVFFFVLGGFL